jgi:ABC-2 type transport system ATP-binding protein
MTSAIVTDGLTKDYGKDRGLFDLNLEVATGEIFGYLGPNGAGKTTTIKTLMDLIHPTAGRAEILGLDCQKQPAEVKRQVGYVPGELPQFGGLRGREIVAYLGAMGGGVDDQRVRSIGERLQLELDQRYREYSSGNKQKLALILAMMHAPRLLILDEPSSGLDPLNQQVFYQLIREARDEGATVFLSSHVLSEVEHSCDHVGIIRNGRLVKVASLEELHSLRRKRVEIEFAGELPADRLKSAAGVEDITISDHRVQCVVRGDFEALMEALSHARVVSLTSHEPSLEEIFLTFYSEDGAPGTSESII